MNCCHSFGMNKRRLCPVTAPKNIKTPGKPLNGKNMKSVPENIEKGWWDGNNNKMFFRKIFAEFFSSTERSAKENILILCIVFQKFRHHVPDIISYPGPLVHDLTYINPYSHRESSSHDTSTHSLQWFLNQNVSVPNREVSLLSCYPHKYLP